MKRKFYTILVVPDATARFRRLRVSRLLILGGGALLAALVVGGALFPHFLSRAVALHEDLARMEEDNQALRQDKVSIQTTVTELRGQVAELEGRAGQLASLIGIDPPFAPTTAAGGGGMGRAGFSSSDSARVVEGELDLLGNRMENLHEALKTLDLAYTKQSQTLSSTPSINPVKGLYGHGYGWRKDPFTGLRDFHHGLDIAAPPGSPVVAPADGVVTRVGQSGGFGKSIIISHGYGVVTRYAHLQGYNVQRGDKIRRGQSIGFVGSTGRSTGPHLHYEVQVHRRNVDPMIYVMDDYRRF